MVLLSSSGKYCMAFLTGSGSPPPRAQSEPFSKGIDQVILQRVRRSILVMARPGFLEQFFAAHRTDAAGETLAAAFMGGKGEQMLQIFHQGKTRRECSESKHVRAGSRWLQRIQNQWSGLLFCAVEPVRQVAHRCERL